VAKDYSFGVLSTSRRQRVFVEPAIQVWLSRHATADDLKRELAAWSYFGRGAQGVEAGAHAWFGKCAGQLRLEEIAFLIGAPQTPGRMEDPGTWVERQQYVMHRLVESGLVTEASAQEALSRPLDFVPRQSSCGE